MNTKTQSNSDAVMRAALKMAIEWVEGWKGIAPSKIELLRVLREALAQPAQEPVATLKITSLGEYDLTLNVPTELHYKALIDAVGIGNHSLFIDGSQSSIGGCCNCKASKGIIGSSTFCDPHPAPSWQGLSDDEIIDMYFQASISPQPHQSIINFIRAIEQALKEKNHG